MLPERFDVAPKSADLIKSYSSIVIILDGDSEHAAQARRKIVLFQKNLFVTPLDLIKCLKHIK